MSWNIYVYAETKSNNGEWEPLTERCVCDDFKYLDVDFFDSLPSMSVSDTAHHAVNTVCRNDIYGDFRVHYCTLEDLKSHYSNIIDGFNVQLRTAYLALGLRANLNDEWYDVQDGYDDGNSVTTARDMMTFPVNKEVFKDLLSTLSLCNKAYQVIGLCDTIDSMCENYNDSIRLLFVEM